MGKKCFLAVFLAIMMLAGLFSAGALAEDCWKEEFLPEEISLALPEEAGAEEAAFEEASPAELYISIKGNSDTVTYDGQPHRVEGFTAECSDEGFDPAKVKCSQEQPYAELTNAGTEEMILYPEMFTYDDPNCKASFTTKNGLITVEPIRITITASDAEKNYDGTPLTQGAFTVSGLPDGDTHEFTVEMTPDSTITNAGTRYNIIRTVDNTQIVDETKAGNYLVTAVDGTLTVNPAPVTLTGNSDTESYCGEEFTVSGFTCSVDGLTFDGVSAEASAVYGGTYPVDFTGVTLNETKDSTGNYVVAETEPGVLTITPIRLTVYALDWTLPYIGGPQGPAGEYTSELDKIAALEGLTVGNDELTGITLTGQETNVGTYEGKVMPSNAQFGDATGSYDVTYVPGGLTITKAAVTVRANTQTYDYDGGSHGPGPLGNVYTGDQAEWAATGDGLQGSDRLTSVKVTGYGSWAKTYEGGLEPSEAQIGDATDNYEISYENGDLVINKRVLTATGTDAGSFQYDGEKHTGTSDYTLDNLTDNCSATITYTPASGTNAGTYYGIFDEESLKVTYSNGWDTEDVTGCYTLDPKPGKLTITPRAGTMGIGGFTAERIYNGEEQTVCLMQYTRGYLDGYDFDRYVRFVKWPAITAKDVGTYPQGLTPDCFENTDPNWDITFEVEDGWLKIDSCEVTASVADRTAPYTGSEQTGNNKVSFDNLVDGHTASITYTPAKGTETGTYDNGSFGDDFLVKDSNGKDVTANYSLTGKTSGKLMITVGGENNGLTEFLLRCYLEGLSRPAQEVLDNDAEGLAYWHDILANDLLTPTQVANYFALSPESQGKYPDNGSYVAMLYRMYMDRHYEQDGFDYWLGLLDSETLTREQVNYYFGISDEFRNIVSGFGLS